MDAIAHTQVSAVCLVTLVVLLRAQQKMRDKSLPGRLFTALLWSAEALTLVDYNSALAQMGAWQELGIPLTYRLNAGGSILFYLLAACCCQLVFLYVEAELGHTWLEDGRKLAFCAAPLALLLLALLTARDENGFCYLDAEGLRGSTLFWVPELVGLAYLAAAFLQCSWTLSHWKQERPKEELEVLLLFTLVPAAGFVLHGWLPGRGVLCCGIALGLVCVYVLVLQTKFTVDTLTGVSNRIVALRYLESELPYYRRHPNRSLHFLMMDMDHFKHINDEYGHLEGDAALVLLAGILKKVCANYNGVLARYGGDEFCIACGCNSVEVRTLIASIQRELDAANAASGKPYQIEISIGCARLEPDIATVHDLIDKADQEMYHLKTRKHGTAPAEKQG